MNENQKESSPSEEDNIPEIDVDEPKDSDLDASGSKDSYSKVTVKNLKRRPLHPKVKDLQEKTEGQCSDFIKIKGTEKQHLPTSSPKSSYVLIFGCLVTLVFVVIVGVFFPYTSQEKQLDVKDLMKKLKSGFDSQPLLTYRVIESAIKSASLKDPKSPGILVLISSREAEETTHELANALVRLVSEPLNSVLVETRSLSPANRLKKEIDITIRGNLTEKQMRGAVLVRNLDQIPFEAAMIFHGFCDDENAPFKKVVYVMTAFVEESISPDSDPKQWDVLASRRLRTAWGDSGEDQVASLISRLTVNVAAVLSK